MPRAPRSTRGRREHTPTGPVAFSAIDFETASNDRDSACAVGAVRVEGGVVTDRLVRLIRPPSSRFLHTGIHGITWGMVAREPTFDGVWPELSRFFLGVDFVAAHNAGFDRSVLGALCTRYGIDMPVIPFLNTVTVARRCWVVPDARLSTVASHLHIPLVHHEAASDAEACAQIVCRAMADRGLVPEEHFMRPPRR